MISDVCVLNEGVEGQRGSAEELCSGGNGALERFGGCPKSDVPGSFGIRSCHFS